jgi:hypothetical protein
MARSRTDRNRAYASSAEPAAQPTAQFKDWSEIWRNTPISSNAGNPREALAALAFYGIRGWSHDTEK